MVSWFLGFKVFGFLVFRFQISWFLGFEESKNPSRYLKEKLTILPNVHIMCFDRYWPHIQDFQEFIGRFFIIFRRPSSPKLTILGMSEALRPIQIILFKYARDFLASLVSPKSNNIDFEARGHVRKSWNHRNEGF